MDLITKILKTHTNVKSIEGNNQNEIIAKDSNGNNVTINWDTVNNYVNPDQYKIDRASKYPSIQEQLDLQYHDQLNGTTKWKDKIKSIKDKYPKPSEE